MPRCGRAGSKFQAPSGCLRAAKVWRICNAGNSKVAIWWCWMLPCPSFPHTVMTAGRNCCKACRCWCSATGPAMSKGDNCFLVVLVVTPMRSRMQKFCLACCKAWLAAISGWAAHCCSACCAMSMPVCLRLRWTGPSPSQHESRKWRDTHRWVTAMPKLPSAVTTSFCANGDTISALSPRRTQTG